MAVWRLEQDIGQDDWVNSEDQTFFKGFQAALTDVKMWVLVSIIFPLHICARDADEPVAGSALWKCFCGIHHQLLPDRCADTWLFQGQDVAVDDAAVFARCYYNAANRQTCRQDRGTVLPHLPSSLPGYDYIHYFGSYHQYRCSICQHNAHGESRRDATAITYLTMNSPQIPGLYSGYTTALAWISNTLPRPPAKRAAALAFINAISNATSIYTSYLYPKSAKPRYEGAFIHNCLMAALAIVAAGVLRMMLARLNKKLDRGEHVEGAINATPGEAAEHGFRYRL